MCRRMGSLDDLNNLKHCTEKALKFGTITKPADAGYVRKLLTKHDELYFANEQPIVSDEDYDKLYFMLQEWNSEDVYFQKVHEGASNKFKKIKHIHPMRSLGKAQETKTVEKYLKKWTNKFPYITDEFVVQNKEDGLTIVFYYKEPTVNDGQFTAVTRGGGLEGEDVTHVFKHMKSFVQIIKNLEKKNMRVIVRGEAIIDEKSFNEINDELSDSEKYMNARNLVAGSIRTKDASIASDRNVQFLAYNIENLHESEFDNLDKTERAQLKFLHDLGFTTTENNEARYFKNDKNGRKKLIKFINDFDNNKRKAVGHDIDGLVIKPVNMENEQHMHVTDHDSEAQIAYKFKSDGAMTKLLNVEWQIGTTGQVTPVAIVKPVQLFGATISKASLASYDNIMKRDLRIGDTIYIRRSNDVIPQIVKSFPDLRDGSERNVVIPVNMHFEGKLLFTDNETKEQQLGKWRKLVSKDVLNIDALSEKSIKKLADNHMIDLNDFSSLFNLNHDEFVAIDGFGEQKWTKLESELEKSKQNTTFDKILLAFNVRTMGHKFVEKFTQMFPTYNSLFSKSDFLYANKFSEIISYIAQEFISSTQGFTQNSFSRIEELFSDENQEQILKLEQLGFDFNKEVKTEKAQIKNNTKISGLHFVLTGKMSRPRKEYEKEIVNNGGIIDNGVKKDTSYLVINDKNSKSSKTKKALELSTPMISEEELVKMIGE